MPESPDAGRNLPERKLTSQQFEVVIRRAAELQARAADEGAEAELSEGEVIRIGREIGISPQHIRRALAEAGRPEQAKPALGDRLMGPQWIRASRAVPGGTEEVRQRIDEYMVKREWLAPIRRHPDRTVYEKERGVDLARALRMVEVSLGGRSEPTVGAGFKLRKARRTEVVVQPLEEGFSYVTLGTDLGNWRAGLAAGAGVAGGAGGLAVATALGIAVDPVAAILGLPVLGSSVWGARAIQLRTADRALTHLEAILDCMERGEPLVGKNGGRLRR